MNVKTQKGITIVVAFGWMILWATASGAEDMEFGFRDKEMVPYNGVEQKRDEWVDSATVDQDQAAKYEPIDIKVYMPTEGSKFFVGQGCLVYWTTTSNAQKKYPYVNLDLVVRDTNQDIMQTLSLAQSTQNDGTHTVTIPASTKVTGEYYYRIRVTADIGFSVYWESGVISISYARLISPEYAETICKGAELAVDWHPKGVLNNIVLCLKSNNTGATIIKKGINDILSSTPGSYLLDIPYTLKSGKYKLSISSSDGQIYDANAIDIGQNCYHIKGIWDTSPPGTPVSFSLITFKGSETSGSASFKNISGTYKVDLQTKKVNCEVIDYGYSNKAEDLIRYVFKGKFKSFNVIEFSYRHLDYQGNHIPFTDGSLAVPLTATRLIKAE